MRKTAPTFNLVSPLLYFGNRTINGQNQEDIFKLINEQVKQRGKPFDVCYDLFSGSASFSLMAMNWGIAKQYVVNDSYTPLKEFWIGITNPESSEKLIEIYGGLVEKYLSLNDPHEKTQFYSHIQSKFNEASQTTNSHIIEKNAEFAFLINFAQDGMPEFSINPNSGFQQLACHPAKAPSNEAFIETFANRVRSLNQFFQKQNIQFTDKDFSDFQDQISQKDLVYLEPPYPDMEDNTEKSESYIYHRTKNKSQLQTKLIEFLEVMSKQQISYAMLYGVLGLQNQHPIALPQNHVFHLAGHADFKFKEYVEHLYLSKDFIDIVLSDTEYQKTIQPLFHQIFETQAIHNAEHDALNWHGQISSYAKTNQAANRLARILLKEGLETDLAKQQEVLVTLYLERGPQLIISLLAVMKCGAAFMPLDTSQARLSIEAAYERIKRSDSHYVLTTPELAKQLNDLAKKNNEQLSCIFIEIDVNDFWCEKPTNQNILADNLNHVISPEALAYVMYTSGSSGEPKGVEILHRGIPYALLSHQDLINLGPQDKILQFGSVGFDASLMEIFITLSCGASLHLIDEKTFLDTFLLRNFIKEHHITVAILTPKKLEQLDPKDFSALRAIFIVGDKVDEELAKKWRRAGKIVVVGYGLTETTICSTLDAYELGHGLSIGKPMLGLTAKLMPLEGQAQSLFRESAPTANPNQSRELYFKGPCVTRGYWKNSTLTNQRFLKLDTNDNSLWYKTGDVVKVLSDGRFDYLGRVDRQIKLRGQRLELDEIEQRFRQHLMVKDARVVTFFDEKGKPKSLAAYLVMKDPKLVTPYRKLPNNEALDAITNIRDFLKEKVPGFMCPSKANFLFVKQLPVKGNDKNSYHDQLIKEQWSPPCIKLPVSLNLKFTKQEDTKTMVRLREIFAEVLGIKQNEMISDESDFYELSGDSLLVNRYLAQIKRTQFANKAFQEMALELTVAEFNQEPTLKGLWQWFEKRIKEKKELQKTFVYKMKSLPLTEKLFALNTSIIDNQFHHKRLMPFFVVHSLLGNAQLDYENSVLQKLPVHLHYLNAPTPSSAPFDSQVNHLDNLLKNHISTIKKENFDGLYWLLGWSTGGWLALEIARRLRNEGNRVFVYMIDTQHPDRIHKVSPTQWMEQLLILTKKVIKAALCTAEGVQYKLSINEQESVKNLLLQETNRESQIKILFQYIREYIEKTNRQASKTQKEQLIAAETIINQAEYLFLMEYQQGLNPNLVNKQLDEDTFLFVADRTEQFWGPYLGWSGLSNNYKIINNTNHFKLIKYEQILVNHISDKISNQLKNLGLPWFHGLELMENEKYEEAILQFSKTIEESPKKSVAYVNRGICKYSLEQYKEAVNDFTCAIRVNGTYNDIAYFYRATCYAKQQMFSEAIKDYSQTLAHNKNYLSAYYYRGRTHYYSQNYPEAIVDLEHYLKISSKNTQHGIDEKNKDIFSNAYFYMGTAKGILGKNQESIKYLRESIEINSSADAHYNLGISYTRIKNFTQAIIQFDFAIKIDSKFEGALFYRARINQIIGKLDDAIEDLKKLLILNSKSVWAYQTLGDIYYTRGTEGTNDNIDVNEKKKNIKMASLYYKKALEIDPNNELLKEKLAGSLFLIDKNVEAIKSFEQLLLNKDYNKPTIIMILGLAKAREGDDNAAIKHYNDYLKQEGNDAQVYYFRGKSYFALKNYQQAIKDFDKAISLNPETDFYYYRGLAKSNLNLLHEAVQDIEMSIKFQSDYPEAYFMLSKLYCQLIENKPNLKYLKNTKQNFEAYFKYKDQNIKHLSEAYFWYGKMWSSSEEHDKALEAFSKSLKLDSTKSNVYFNRAMTYLTLGKQPEALQDVESTLKLDPNHEKAKQLKATLSSSTPSIFISSNRSITFFPLNSSSTGSTNYLDETEFKSNKNN